MHILRFFTCFLMKLGIFGLVILTLNLAILPHEVRAAEAVSAPASEAEQAHAKALVDQIVALQRQGRRNDWPLETLGQCWDKIEELALYVEKHPGKYDISPDIGFDYSSQIRIPGGREILTKMRKVETLKHEIRFIKKDGISADWPIITLGKYWDKIEELALYVEQNPDINRSWLSTLQVNPAYSVEIGTPGGREILAKFRIADTLAYEIHHGNGGKADELLLHLQRNSEIIVRLVIELSPAVVSDIVKVDSIRHFLRGYRNEHGSTILNKAYSATKYRLLDAYLKDGMVTHDELNFGWADLDVFDELSPEHQKVFFTNYRNQKGQNLLHLINSSDFDKFKAAIGDVAIVDGLLIQPDHFGVTPLMKFAARGDNFNAFQRALIEKGIDVEQVDIIGNTAEMFYRARKHKNPDQILAAQHFAQKELSHALWQSIKDEPCFLYMKEMYGNGGEIEID
ncbi:MAG: hypothetical protein K2Q34_00580 [Alphaproteobacteria bacterium]|nr:hypothetical protein [Alphaproteobacteria bacterium]